MVKLLLFVTLSLLQLHINLFSCHKTALDAGYRRIRALVFIAIVIEGEFACVGVTSDPMFLLIFVH